MIRSGAAATLLSLLGSAGAAMAQIAPPDTFDPVDANGVSLTNGTYRGPNHTLMIGPPGAGGLSVTVNYDTSAGEWHHSLAGGLASTPLFGEGSRSCWFKKKGSTGSARLPMASRKLSS